MAKNPYLSFDQFKIFTFKENNQENSKVFLVIFLKSVSHVHASNFSIKFAIFSKDLEDSYG